MVYEFDQWSPEMLDAVKLELNKRKIFPDDFEERKKSFLDIHDLQMSIGKDYSLVWMIIGWLSVFGFLGITGYNYAYSKKHSHLINKKYFIYNESTRKKGQILFFSSFILSALNLLIKIS